MNSLTDNVYLFSTVSVVSAWPSEILQIGLNDYSHAASLTANSAFYRPDYQHVNAGNNSFSYTYLAVTSLIAPGSAREFQANTYPDVLGSALAWRVSSDNERGNWSVKYIHPDVDYAKAQYTWHSSVFPSRVVPQILNGSTYSIEISSVLAAPFVNNTATNALPLPYAPAALAKGVTAPAPQSDLQFSINRYSQLISAYNPLSDSTYVRYMSGNHTITTTFTAANVAGITQSSWTSALNAPVASGSVYGTVNFTTASASKIWQIFDYATAGSFIWFENGTLKTGASAGGTASINYNTGVMQVNYAPPLYFTRDIQARLTYDYYKSSINGYNLSQRLSSFNHKTSAYNTMAQFYSAANCDHVTLSSTDVPIYMYDIEIDVSRNGTTSSAPTANGYTISFLPTAVCVNVSANVIHVSGGFVSNWYSPTVWNLVPGWHTISYSTPTDVVLPTGVVALTGSNLSYNVSTATAIDGSTYLVLSAAPDSRRTEGTLLVTLSSVDGSPSQTFTVPWVLNPDNWTIYPYIDYNDNDSARLRVLVENFNVSDNQEIAWIVSPNENITITSQVNGRNIPLNSVCYWSTGSPVVVSNLGVGLTQITVSSINPSNSGSVFWSPSSWNNVSLDLHADISNFNNRSHTRTLPLSAKLKKHGLFYSMPSTVQLTWLADYPAPVAAYGFASGGGLFSLNQPVNGALYNTITANFVPPTVVSNPSRYTIPLYCVAEASFLSISSNPVPTYIITVDDFPAINLLSVSLSSNVASTVRNIATFTSNRTHDVFVPVAATNLLFEDTSIVHQQNGRYVNLTRTWTLSSGNSTTVLPTTGSLLDVTLTPTGASISAVVLSVDYYSDTWQSLHTQQLPVYIHFANSVPTLSARAFPTYTWVESETNPRELTFANYSASSNGLTAYGNCHSEIVHISASNVFDLYSFQFGDFVITTLSPTASATISCPGVTSTAILGVSAYNAAITPDTPSLYYDLSGHGKTLSNTTTTPTTGSSKFWKQFEFIDYPAPSISVSSADIPSFSLGNVQRPVLDIDIVLQHDPHLTKLQSPLTVNFTVEGAQPYTFDHVINAASGDNLLQAQFQVADPNAPRYLSNIVATPITITISGQYSQYLGYAPNDYCPSTRTIATTSFEVTAFPSPIIELFESAGVGCVNTPFWLINATAATISSVEYDQFIIDYGNGVTSTIAASSQRISAQYADTGTYYLSVSGIQEGQLISTQTFGPLIVFADCNQDANAFDSSITRHLGDQFVLPYPCHALSVQNEWVTKDTINSLFAKVSANLQYVIDQSTMYDPRIPRAYVGWYGAWNRSKQSKWNINSESKFEYDQAIKTSLGNLKAIAWDDNYNVVHLVKNNQIIMCAYDANMTQISPAIDMPLADFKACALLKNTLFVVDAHSNGVYAYEAVPYSTSPYKLVQYFAQFGDEHTKQGLNNPTDIACDENELFVVDSSNYSIKVYNTSLAWVDQFTCGEFRDDVVPISIAIADDSLLVCASNNTVYVFNRETKALTTSWKAGGEVTRIRIHDKQPQFVNVLTTQGILKYTKHGTYIGTFDQPKVAPLLDVASNNKYVSLFISEDKIFAVIDLTSTKTIRTTRLDQWMWPFEQTQVQANDLVSTVVYNSIIKRFWDNILLADKSIHSKFVQYMTPQVTDLNFAIVAATSADKAVYDDTQIYIGDNELVTSPVIERSISALCAAIATLANRVATVRDFDPCVDQLCWTWDALKGTHTPFSANCQSNPLTWYELRSEMPTTFSKRWCDATGCGCTS